MIANSTIEIGGRPLFERARIEAPSKIKYALQDFACFFYIVEGEYEAVIDQGSYKIGSREALIKKCGNYISKYSNRQDADACEAVAVYLYPDVLHEIYKFQVPSFLDESKIPSKPKSFVGNELIEKYISNLFVYFDNPELIDEELARLKVKELIMILLKSDQYEDVRHFLAEVFSPGNLSFTSVVENNVFSNLSVEDLAFLTKMSLSTFKREFKRVYNESPARYIKLRKLEMAASLLQSSNDPISSIAFDSGFQDASTFSDAFAKRFGQAPSQFRLTKTGKDLA